MNYPSELEEMIRKNEGEEWRKEKRCCLASEQGGCFCTGQCEGKGDREKAFKYTREREIEK